MIRPRVALATPEQVRTASVTTIVILALIGIPPLITHGETRWALTSTSGLLGCLLGLLWLRARSKSSADAATRSAELPYLIPRELPLNAPLFVGRSGEIDRILDLLRREASAGPRVVVIVGEPGIGKTTLAVRVAHAAAALFPDGQVFAEVHTSDASTVKRVLRCFVGALQKADQPVARELDGLRERFVELATDRRILFVLDDVTSADVVQPLLPIGRGCAVLITARTALADLVVPHETVRLGPLDKGEALRVIEAIAGPQRVANELEQAREIVRATGGHPLSIRTAAAGLAATPHSSLAAALRRLSNFREHSGSNADEDLQALDLSFALLTAQEQDAVRALDQLNEPSFQPWMLAALLDVDEEDALRFAERLSFAGFVERTSLDSVGIPLFLIPERVHQYARTRLRDTDGRSQDEALARLARRVRERAQSDQVEVLTARVLDLIELGKLFDAIASAREAVALAREHEGEDRDAEGRALAAFAEVRAELGSFEAADDLARAALADPVRSDLAEARARRCLGRLNRRLHQYGKAEYQLTIAYEKAHDDVNEQIQVLRELAVVQAAGGSPWAAAVQVDKALQLCEQSPEIGDRHRAGLYWARSFVLEHLGRYDDSRAMIEAGQAAAEQRGQLLLLAWLLHRAARLELARRQPDLKRVRLLGREAIEMFATMNHRYGKAHCRLVMGEACLAEDRTEEAAPLLEEAMENFLNCGDRWSEAESARLLALARPSDQRAETERLLGAAQRIFEDLGDYDRAKAVQELIERSGQPKTAHGLLSGRRKG